MNSTNSIVREVDKATSCPPKLPPDARRQLRGLYTVDALVAWAYGRAEAVTAGEFMTMACQMDGDEGPWLLYSLRDQLTPEALRLTGFIWSGAEYPDRELEASVWLEMFEAGGYTHDGQPAERPKEPIRLYRGSVADRRLNWSWTERIEVAEKFAAGDRRGRPLGKVWTAEVEPWRLLCRNDDRSEAEFVINTEGLHVEEWEGNTGE